MDHLESAAALDALTKRSELLDLLRDGPRRKSDLAERAAVSRSTIDRALRQLELAGLIERCQGGFALTLGGRLMLEAYHEFHARLEDYCRAHPLVSALPADSRLESELLRDATIVRPEPQAPMKPVLHFRRLVDGADRLRGLSPAILPSYVDVFRTQVVEHGMTAELVLDSGVLERLTADYADEFGEVLATGDLTVYEAASELPFGLVITDDGTVGVVLYEQYSIQGLIVNDTDAALVWADRIYREICEDGERIEVGE